MIYTSSTDCSKRKRAIERVEFFMIVLRILAWILMGSLALIFIGALFSFPLLFFIFGIPWLPSIPHESESQIELIGLYYPLFAGFAIWLRKPIFRCLHWCFGIGSFQAKTPKPQSLYPPGSQAPSGTYPDPVIIGGGREKNEGLYWFGIFVGSYFVLLDLIIIAADSRGVFLHWIAFLIILMFGLVLILGGIAIRPYGKRIECLKIGSEGIAHYSREKGDVFIPWDEMSRAYIDLHYISRYLYIVLEDDSNLFYEESVKFRYESNIGASGAVMICQVSNSSRAIIQEHLVERALQRYAPSRVR